MVIEYYPPVFWYRRELNIRYLIQSSKILPFELIGTHNLTLYLLMERIESNNMLYVNVTN